MSTTVWSGDFVLFDIDGTLVESMGTIERHTRIWAARHGLDGDELLEYWHGRRDIDVISKFVPQDLVHQELAWIRDISLKDVSGITSIPGGLELVHSIEPGRWGLVTSGERDVVVSRLKSVGYPIPDVLVAAEDIHRGKPHPEGYLSAAQLLGANPARCIVFEDAESGIQAARSAGMHAVMVGDSASAHPDVWHVASFKKVRLVTQNRDPIRLDFAD
ncbi:HAD-IA family hydrolase [Streptomyces sp. NRRL B-1381]|uniref:HAD-IA family hydrolase n=1 Tax=Streptomyces sp. NRRL B-1381 TaxID=1463829 RepID=UPI00067CED59|nr:HAD-IA family hydrolase [Streptomyces sp. NRRL B-1381]